MFFSEGLVSKSSSNDSLISLSTPRGGAASDSLTERLKIGFYFGLWYALNVVYNSKFMPLYREWSYYLCTAHHIITDITHNYNNNNSCQQKSIKYHPCTTHRWNNPIWYRCTLCITPLDNWIKKNSKTNTQR